MSEMRGAILEDQRVLLQRSLIRVNSKMARASKRHLEQYNISGAEYGIIRNLGDKALTLSELSQQLLRVNSNTTAMIDSLEQKGLVQRVRDPVDRRVIRVKLTETGSKLRDAVVPSHNRYINSFFGSLNDGEIANLQKLLQKIESICDHP
jgi:MarR family transcriptional regulator, 2-MHQ and catechol-resistance regulon repressor